MMSPGGSPPISAGSRPRPSHSWSAAWATTPPSHPPQRPACADGPGQPASGVGERHDAGRSSKWTGDARRGRAELVFVGGFQVLDPVVLDRDAVILTQLAAL